MTSVHPTRPMSLDLDNGLQSRPYSTDEIRDGFLHKNNRSCLYFGLGQTATKFYNWFGTFINQENKFRISHYQTLKLIFLIYVITKQNIEVSGQLYLTKISLTVSLLTLLPAKSSKFFFHFRTTYFLSIFFYFSCTANTLSCLKVTSTIESSMTSPSTSRVVVTFRIPKTLSDWVVSCHQASSSKNLIFCF